MEITLDVELVRDILAREYARAREDIEGLGVLTALERSLRRQDERIAAAPDVGTLACRPGCAWCCHFTVDVRPAEVFGILDFVERSLADTEKSRVFSEVRANAALLKNLDENARAMRNVKCPFLNEHQCVIYAARPQTCRNYHATDATGCRQSFEAPDDLDIDPDFAPGVYQAGHAHVEAFSAAMQAGGFDVRVYEMNTALEAALSDPDARHRFESGLDPFTDLEGDEIIPEFDDLRDRPDEKASSVR